MKFALNAVITAAAVLLSVATVSSSFADTNVNANTALSGSSATSAASQGNGNAQDVNINNPAIPSNTQVKMAPAITAPGLTTTLTESCLGSVSGGVSILGGGIVGGSTIKDSRCGNRLDAREIRSWGDVEVAKEIMCGTDEVRAAYKRVGRPCIEDQAKPVVATTKEEHHINDGMKNHVKSGQ